MLNGQLDATLPFTDRGLAYGDGVYRTFLVQQGQPILWSLQYQKLAADCARLNLPLCPSQQLLHEIQQLNQTLNLAVAKVMITRGEGARGYAIPKTVAANRIVMLHPHTPRLHTAGLRLFVCQLRLAHQPVLAGIKHLNRLENVLARSEQGQEDVDEGLLLDQQGQVIECTSGNLFARFGDQLITPDLSLCGVAGAMRDYVLAHAHTWRLQATIQHLSLAQILQADELIMTNSVTLACSISQIGDRVWPEQNLAASIRAQLLST